MSLNFARATSRPKRPSTRWRGGLSDKQRPDHRFSGAHRIARLRAAVAGDLATALVRRRLVIGDAGGRALQRAAAPIGAGRAALDDHHPDSERSTSSASDSDKPFTACLVAQ